MNDYRSDIQQFLKANGFSNVFFDGFVATDNQSDAINSNQINIESESEISNDDNFPITTAVIGIYVKNASLTTAISQSKQIKALLNGWYGRLISTGTPVRFKRISCITEPHNWSRNTNNQNLYLTRFKLIFEDPDKKNIHTNPRVFPS